MQKKVFLSVVMSACLMGTTVTVFNACSNDEVEEQQLESKADYLRAKAKEFSKKYGVDMSLNEENMDNWAETLTVEQLEADFQILAALKAQQIIQPVAPQKVVKKGIKIRTTKTAEEIRDATYKDTDSANSPKYLGITNNMGVKVYRDVIVSVDASWQFGNKVSNHVYADVSIPLSILTTLTGSDFLSDLSYSTTDGFSFLASGNVSLSSANYTLTIYITLSYDEMYKLKIVSVS